MPVQGLVYVLLGSIFLPDALWRLRLIPRFLTWMPELVSILALIVAVLLVINRKTFLMPGVFLLFILICGLHIFLGVIVNHVPAGPVIIGIRESLKYIPFFFLPIVYRFSNEEIAKQLKLILVLALMQLPLSLYQRFVFGANITSGDIVQGSFSTGGHQSVFLVSVIAMLMAFYLRGKITWRSLLVLMVAVGLPTMINETKATVFLLPIALVVPIFTAGLDKGQLKRIAMIGSAGAVFYASFFSVYFHFYGSRSEGVVEHFDFFSEEGRFNSYLAPQTSGVAINRMGKVDRIVITMNELSKDPITLIFGLGLGNLSESFFGERFTGPYYNQFGHLKEGTLLARTLWETGVLGLFFVFVAVFLILRYALKLKSLNDTTGVFCHGWVGVMVVTIVALPYRDLLHDNITGYMLTFYCGYVVSSWAVHKRSLSEDGGGGSNNLMRQ